MAYIVGAYEHPIRDAGDKTIAQLQIEATLGALDDAGLSKDDIDGFFCGPDAPGTGPLSLADYMNLNLRHVDTTNTSGSSYVLHVAHAVQAIQAGKCNVALVTLAGRPNAVLRTPVTVEEVVNSPLVADPLRRLDCCIISDGGGAILVARPEIAKSLKRPLVRIKGTGERPQHQQGGYFEITQSGAFESGQSAFAEAGVVPADIKYVSLYDSFTITVLIQLEDLGFCKKGEGGRFVMDGNLISGVGKLPFNTDGGGLCNNHPGNRGGMTKMIEAVRQLRGEAHPAVQVANCDLALVNAIGGMLGIRHASGTLILEREG